MKKIIAIIMTLLMVMSFAACGSEPAPAPAEENEAPAAVAVEEVGVASTDRDATIPAYFTLPADFNAENAYDLVVLIHGHHGNHNEWGGYDAVSNGLAENGIIAVTLDFAACGASTETFETNSMSHMCADVLDVINYAKEIYKIEAVGAMGYSMGGRIVCQMLIEDMVSYDSICFVAPAVSLEDMIAMFNGQEYYDNMKAEVAATGEMFPFPGAYGEQLLSAEFFTDLEKYGEEMTEAAAAKYEGNSLMIYAQDDAIIPPSRSQWCGEVFGSTIITVSEGGHSYSFYGTNPAINAGLNAAMVEFFVSDLAE